MNLSKNTILITGGATGIGLGLTKKFHSLGNKVIICSRRDEVLEEAKTKLPGVVTRRVDLTNPEERVALINWLKAEHPETNVLVNNAGIQKWLSIDDPGFFESAKEEIVTNIEAPLHLCQLFMQLSQAKVIMNVTSGLSFSPYVKVPVYSATKAFFRSFTISLRRLLRDKDIEVIEIIPPALNTDLGGKGLHDHAPPVSDFIIAIFAQLEEGRTELTFGSGADRANASAEELRKSFEALNP